jgi:hypothetical protein
MPRRKAVIRRRSPPMLKSVWTLLRASTSSASTAMGEADSPAWVKPSQIAVKPPAGLERRLVDRAMEQGDGGGAAHHCRLGDQGASEADPVEGPRTRPAQHEARSGGLDPRHLHRLGIQPVERPHRMAPRQPHPGHQFGAIGPVAEPAQARVVVKRRQGGDGLGGLDQVRSSSGVSLRQCRRAASPCSNLPR